MSKIKPKYSHTHLGYTKVSNRYENHAESFKARTTEITLRNVHPNNTDHAIQFKIKITTESHKGNHRSTLGAISMSMNDFKEFLNDQGMELK